MIFSCRVLEGSSKFGTRSPISIIELPRIDSEIEFDLAKAASISRLLDGVGFWRDWHPHRRLHLPAVGLR